MTAALGGGELALAYDGERGGWVGGEDAVGHRAGGDVHHGVHDLAMLEFD
jgi:hypothetical protein